MDSYSNENKSNRVALYVVPEQLFNSLYLCFCFGWAQFLVGRATSSGRKVTQGEREIELLTSWD